MKLGKKFIVGAGLLTVLAAIGWLVVNSGLEAKIVQVQPGDLVCTVEDSGYVQPATNYDIHATQSARVLQVPVETGQQVRQGTTLVLLENLDLAVQVSETRSQLSQAQNNVAEATAALERMQIELSNARENLKRMQMLLHSGAIAQTEYDQAKLLADTSQQSLNEQQARLDSAQAQINGLNQSLRQYSLKEQQLVVKSPVDGIILSLPVKQEQVVTPGALLASVAISDVLEIKAEILSDDLAEVHEGQKVNITAPVLGQKVLRGTVQQIYPRAEEIQSALGIMQRRVPVIITLPEPDNLKAGYEVRVAIETLSRQNVLLLPREAVRTIEDSRREVMLLVDNKVNHRLVETGLSNQEYIEITGGLSAGDTVLKDGSLDLKEKARIKPI